MPTDLDRQLLDTDLDRLVNSVPRLITYTCDVHENPKCLVRDHKQVARSCGAQPTKEIAVINREELERLKRDLVEFRRRFKEIHG